MPIESKRVERIVGVFVLTLLAGISVLLFLFLQQRDFFSKKFELRVVFDKGVAITAGAPVMMEGIQVGRVKKMRFNAQNQLEGLLAVNVRFRRQVRKDSVATVVRTHLLANPQVDISVGTPDEPLLGEGEAISGIAAVEPSMKDFISLANNFVGIVRDLRDPQGSFQRTLRNVEEITNRLAQGSGSVPTMLKDDGKLYRDSMQVLGDFGGMIHEKDSVPITIGGPSHLTLMPESALVVSLSEKLDRQTDIFVQVAHKMDKISDRILTKDSLAGAVLSDPEFYQEIRDFFRETRALMLDLSHLATELRTVVPELPGLIQEGKTDLKEMGRVLRGIQRIPFIGTPPEAPPKPETLHAPARINPAEEKQ